MTEILIPEGSSYTIHGDKTRREPLDLDSLIDAMGKIQEIKEAQELFIISADVSIVTEQPVLIVHWADLHLGSEWTDHKAFLEQVKLIKESKNVFVTLNGDDVDNFGVWLPSGADEDILDMEMQGMLCMRALNELDMAGKILYVGSGNHNMFLYGWHRMFARDLRAALLGENMGTCHLKVGNVAYEIFQFHKFSLGNSAYSPWLRHTRALEFLTPDADIIIGGHTHRKSIAQITWGIDANKKMRTFVDCGTFKIKDKFPRLQGNARMGAYGICGACTLLHPLEKKVEVFYDIETGVRALQREIALRMILMAKLGDSIIKIARK